MEECENCGASVHALSQRCVECGASRRQASKRVLPPPPPLVEAPPPPSRSTRPALSGDASSETNESNLHVPPPVSRVGKPSFVPAVPPVPPVNARKSGVSEAHPVVVGKAPPGNESGSVPQVGKSDSSPPSHRLAAPPAPPGKARKSAADEPAVSGVGKPSHEGPAVSRVGKPPFVSTPVVNVRKSGVDDASSQGSLPRVGKHANESPPAHRMPAPSPPANARKSGTSEEPRAGKSVAPIESPPAQRSLRPAAPPIISAPHSPPPVPSVNTRRKGSTESNSASDSSLRSRASSTENPPAKLKPPVPDAKKRHSKESFPEDFGVALRDPYWRTRMQAFAAERNLDDLVVFWTLVDEFKHSTGQVRSVLGARIHQDFLLRPGRIGCVPKSEVDRLASEFSGTLPATFFDALMGCVEMEMERSVYEEWKGQQPKRGVIGAPVLTAQPKTKYTLVPIKEAQEAAGVESRAQHRRSLSLGSSGSAAAAAAARMPPSPFAKRGAPPTPPAGKKESAPPAAGKKESATAPSAPKIIASESDWDSSSINSETCAFDWELLNANNTDPKVETIKCLVVGDCGVGKTTLCKTMLGDDFNPDYTPTVFETYKIRAPIFRQVMVELWDMSGNPKYDKKRPVVYPNVNCFVACFDLTERESWRNVKRKWVPEMMAYPDFALFIVGCGFDRINAANASMCVQPKQVQSFLDKKCRGVFKCAHFVSTSATNGTGLERVFAGIVYATMYAKTKVSEINAGIARIKHLEFVK